VPATNPACSQVTWFQHPGRKSIPLRLPEIDERASFGHEEGDPRAFQQDVGSPNLTSLIERRSLYTILSLIRTGTPPG
jgi:IS30 family transposase